MYEVVEVKPLNDYKLLVVFMNGEKKIKDMKDLLNKPAFKLLRDTSLFNKVTIIDGAITWLTSDGEEIDLCPDKTYQTSY